MRDYSINPYNARCPLKIKNKIGYCFPSFSLHWNRNIPGIFCGVGQPRRTSVPICLRNANWKDIQATYVCCRQTLFVAKKVRSLASSFDVAAYSTTVCSTGMEFLWIESGGPEKEALYLNSILLVLILSHFNPFFRNSNVANLRIMHNFLLFFPQSSRTSSSKMQASLQRSKAKSNTRVTEEEEEPIGATQIVQSASQQKQQQSSQPQEAHDARRKIRRDYRELINTATSMLYPIFFHPCKSHPTVS